tara:strand:- start:8268 stop:8861 length:594 start_codon:yes stop_codon:yes gene_type:complete
MPLFLNVQQLTCVRDDRELFVDLNINVHAGEMMLVEGANGSGKTSLLRIIAGLLTPLDGKVEWPGATSFAYLGHQLGIKSQLTPYENIHFATGATKKLIAAALTECGLSGFEHVCCHQLSAGQQRRVALAILRVKQVDVWILDEPFTALDKAAVAKLTQQIEVHVHNGGSVILTSHQAINFEKVTMQRIALGELCSA